MLVSFLARIYWIKRKQTKTKQKQKTPNKQNLPQTPEIMFKKYIFILFWLNMFNMCMHIHIYNIPAHKS